MGLTVYKTLSPVELGTPAERRGAERSTSGVKCVAWIVMALCLRDCNSHIKVGREYRSCSSVPDI